MDGIVAYYFLSVPEFGVHAWVEARLSNVNFLGSHAGPLHLEDWRNTLFLSSLVLV